jgi:hypothetical protein
MLVETSEQLDSRILGKKLDEIVMADSCLRSLVVDPREKRENGK